MTRAAVVCALLAVALAGCAEEPSPQPGTGPAPDFPDPTPDGGDAPMPEPDENETMTPNATRSLSLVADNSTGDVPLAVTFTFDAEFEQDATFTWSFNPGDGSDPSTGDQADYRGNASYTYDIGGNYTAFAALEFTDGEELSANATVTATVPEGGGSEPLQTEFDYGPTGGCSGREVDEPCAGILVAQNSGEVRTIDGHFQSLDQRYWGLTATATGAVLDTECYFLDADFEIIGAAHNSIDDCTGTIPADAAWIFMFPYGLPIDAMHLSIT